eukprot:NODE_1801_length_1402_cov_29.601626_g1629_i0.p1 GENE.NODE_1801_length_1402_cov_29.601626_g1629_i0~~NODE_1801_length_1402_cov_29.601626_g1629_i0.p1  ORF type:complete len:458 (+),score=76.29 NODE_1801_length_1402_cov_29.601626_g1629_i0:80-1375(+)
MPLVVFCGVPCSGKTTLALKLKTHLAEKGQEVTLINEESLGIEKAEGYAGSYSEKQTRARFKQAVEQAVSPANVVICDTVNYIKGFRYELWCLARSMETTYCVVFCQCRRAVADLRNQQLQRWPSGLFSELVVRFETPLGNVKWDQPLFIFSFEGDPNESSSLSHSGTASDDIPQTAVRFADGKVVPTFPSRKFAVSPQLKEAPLLPSKQAPLQTRATFQRRNKPCSPLSTAKSPESSPTCVDSTVSVWQGMVDQPSGIDLVTTQASEESLLCFEPASEALGMNDVQALYITSQQSYIASSQRLQQQRDRNPALEEISTHLLNSERFRQHVAVKAQKLGSANALSEVASVTADAIDFILSRVADFAPGEDMAVSGCTEMLVLPSSEAHLSLPNLRALRAQFLRVAQLHPPKTKEVAGNMFVTFLNTAFQKT